jgi:hypothetical protein
VCNGAELPTRYGENGVPGKDALFGREREGGRERERERENGQSARVPLFVHRNYNTFDTIYVLYVYVPRCHHHGTFPNPP